MKKILVPIDFSKCANNAMTFALELASRSNAAVHALHVIYPSQDVDNKVYNAFWVDEYFKRREHDLVHCVNRFRKNQAFSAVPITSSCEIGYPVNTIKRVAEEQQVDLIVMGTTGATGIWTVLGSTAARIISGGHVPVFAIPAKANFLCHTDYVLATDFDLHIAPESLKMLKDILHFQHAGVHVLHVLEQPDKEPDKAMETNMQKVLAGLNYQFHYVHDANIPRAVRKFIERSSANGLIVLSHHHSFLHQLMFQRVSRVLTQQSRVPILVLHENSAGAS